MNTIKIVAAANYKYVSYMETLIKACNMFNHEISVFDLGGLGYGDNSISATTFDWGAGTQRITFKPKIVHKILHSNNYDFYVWIDADAFPISSIQSIADDYDVGVVLRRPKERFAGKPGSLISGLVNSGVISFANTEAAKIFVRLWIDEMPNTPNYSDQEALNKILIKISTTPTYDDIIVWNGIRIKYLHNTIYNFYNFPERPDPRTKILHFKTGKREYYDSYVKEYING